MECSWFQLVVEIPIEVTNKRYVEGVDLWRWEETWQVGYETWEMDFGACYYSGVELLYRKF